MKVSYHASKTEGSASHNDRTFDLEKADHIEVSRIKDNHYWCINPKLTFEEAEKEFYKAHYQEMMDDQNGRRRESMDVEDYLSVPRYCPEEFILQIGKWNDTLDDPKVFDECFEEFMKYLEHWNQTHGNHMHVLNYAIHKDEVTMGVMTVHGHVRRVWDWTREDGKTWIGVEEALKQAGVPLPDPTKPESKTNHRKKMFDAMCREKWIEICEERGIEVDRKVDKTNTRHQRISAHKRDKYIEDAQQLFSRTKHITEAVNGAMAEIPDDRRRYINEEPYIVVGQEEYQDLAMQSEMIKKNKERIEKRKQEIEESKKRNQILQERLKKQKSTTEAYEKKAEDLKTTIQEIGNDVMVETMQAGKSLYHNPTPWMQEALDTKPDTPYDSSRFESLKDAIEEAYRNSEAKQTELERLVNTKIAEEDLEK